MEWDGDDPYRMDVPILLDGWAKRQTVENDVAKLNQMMQSPNDLTPPVQVYIDGAVPVKGAKWVIETIDWVYNSMVIWTTDARGGGYRVRQDAIVHLLQFVAPKVLQVNTPNQGVPIVVKAEQTLATIAKDFNIGVDAILKANGKRDSKSVKTGDHLILPASPFNLPIS